MEEFSDDPMARAASPDDPAATYAATYAATPAASHAAANGHNGASPESIGGDALPLDASGDVRLDVRVDVREDVSTMATVGRGRADTWGSNLPALRLAPAGPVHPERADHTGQSNHTDYTERVEPHESNPEGEPGPAHHRLVPSAPASLRLVRGLVGIFLLLLAWAATVGCITLAQLVLGGFPQESDLAARVGLYVVAALAAVWVGVVALACLVAGAFALALAVTSRGW